MKPGFDSIGFQKYQNELHNTTFDKLIETIKRLNDEISRDESLGDGFQIGHSYLCGLKSCDKVKEIIFYDIFLCYMNIGLMINKKLIFGKMN